MAVGLLDGLNEQQRAAVMAGTGPVLVLAGPGSGKTRVLTHRIAYLVGNMGVSPDAIMAVTFTNKAAGEMRGRVQNILQGNLHGLQIGTFHAICARLLRREWQHTPYSADYVIFDTDDQVTVMTQTLAEIGIDPKKWNPRRVLNAVSSAKNELIPPEKYIGNDYFGEIVTRAYRRYQAVLLDNNAMDFDDLLMQMVVLLREKPSVCDKYQQRYEFMLVDEFQDTNTAQYELVRLLGHPQNNVFVVGDEDQGIYAFRGADYRNVLQFRSDYPQSQVILLEQNYRSTQIVLDAARAVIDKNQHRTPKALFTERQGGALITLEEAYNDTEEAEFVLDSIEKLRKRQGLSYKDVAVMYRTNAQSQALEAAFVREGVPYRLIGGVGFYKRREIRDLLAYLRMVNNPNDKVSFGRVINIPKRGIGEKSAQDFYQWAAEVGGYREALERLIRNEPSPLAKSTAKKFAEVGKLLAEWRTLADAGDLVELLDNIISRIGYNLYLHEISDTPEQAVDRQENVARLRGLTVEAREKGISLADFLAEQSLVADVDELKDDDNTVTLLTLHAAKGLEYPIVFITGVEEGLLPHSRSLDDADGLAEERRLMYVGLTRAKDRVYLTYAFRRTLYGNSNPSIPSRFLSDIPKELTEGMSARVIQQGNMQRFREDTTWETPGTSRLAADLNAARKDPTNNPIRAKILPFPGSKSLRFKTGQRVHHPVFGDGQVVGSAPRGDDEEVTVVFENKKAGIKKLYAGLAKLTLIE